ncbi:MAG: PIN domain-containing protein [Burkholderiales bacterium]|nr:PIN domain-containing protein [Nitrosomonas sp.]MCP5274384.1 PIN domain-containing protein [Burkholderiales bacterium]
MKDHNAFLDTNILLYLLSEDETKSAQAENTIAAGGIISVQVLNEFVSMTRRKLNMSFAEIREFLSYICVLCPVIPVTVKVHEQGLRIAEHYGFSIYDAMIVAAALSAGCTTLYSENMQNNQKIDDLLLIQNPFT